MTDAPEPPPRTPDPPPRMSHRKVTPPVYRDSFNVAHLDSGDNLNSPSRSRTNTEKSDAVRDFLERLRIAPKREEESKSILQKEELGTIIHDENVMNELITSLSGVVMEDSRSEETSGPTTDSEIELMDEKGLMNNVHVAARWLMSNASPQCAFYKRRNQKRIAALCLAMRREEKSSRENTPAKKEVEKEKKNQTISPENMLRELRVVSLKGLAPVCSILLSTIRDLHSCDASKYANTMNVLGRSVNENTATSLKEILRMSEIPSQTEELRPISNYIVRQMGLEVSMRSTSNDLPFQVSLDLVSHVKSTVVQRACVETMTAVGVSRRSLRDVLTSIVSLIRQPHDEKTGFDVDLSVSLNCMRDMLQKFRSQSQASKASTSQNSSAARRVSIVQGITTTPRHHNSPPSFSQQQTKV